MYNLKQEIFTNYKGLKIPMWFREDTNDWNTITSILVNDEYETKKITYSPGDTFVDLGSHIGAWSALIDSLEGTAHIIAVEPLPENVELTKKNSKAITLSNAVSNRSGTKTKIYYGGKTEGGLHHKFVGNTTAFPFDGFYEAETISLNDLFKDIDHCRVLKIDVEGAEFSAFMMASLETLSKIDYIVGEYHNSNLEPTRTRAKLFSYTRGLFEDISEDKEEKSSGLFLFKRI